MNVAYVFKTDMSATFQLATMILPQLESETHVAGVCGMFFFDDNIHILSEGNEFGVRLSKLARKRAYCLWPVINARCEEGIRKESFLSVDRELCPPKALLRGQLWAAFLNFTRRYLEQI